MRDLELGQVVRALRRRHRWRQDDCAERAGVHRSTWSLLELGQLDRFTVATLRRCLAVVGVRLDLDARWRGPELARLRDAVHAALQAWWKTRLERWTWRVLPEVSYSRYGERGRVDLLAWHPPTGILAVIEIKSEIVDIQDLLGSLDVKVRLAGVVAREAGLPVPRFVVPVLIAAGSAANRRRVQRFAALFARFSLRGKAGVSWLRVPAPSAVPAGLLVFTNVSTATGSRVTHDRGARVRLRRVAPSVDEAAATGAAAAEVG